MPVEFVIKEKHTRLLHLAQARETRALGRVEGSSSASLLREGPGTRLVLDEAITRSDGNRAHLQKGGDQDTATQWIDLIVVEASILRTW